VVQQPSGKSSASTSQTLLECVIPRAQEIQPELRATNQQAQSTAVPRGGQAQRSTGYAKRDAQEYSSIVEKRNCFGNPLRIALTSLTENAPAECAIVATAWDPGEATDRTIVFGRENKMAERPVLVGLIPQAVVLDPGDQVSWISDAGNLRVEFDVNRCPFSSNVFQAPTGMRLLSGPPRPGSKAASYKYRLWLNDQLVGHGEVILREK
jgi:hypothetical protein